jgi:hypothetical protein
VEDRGESPRRRPCRRLIRLGRSSERTPGPCPRRFPRRRRSLPSLWITISMMENMSSRSGFSMSASSSWVAWRCSCVGAERTGRADHEPQEVGGLLLGLGDGEQEQADEALAEVLVVGVQLDLAERDCRTAGDDLEQPQELLEAQVVGDDHGAVASANGSPGEGSSRSISSSGVGSEAGSKPSSGSAAGTSETSETSGTGATGTSVNSGSGESCWTEDVSETSTLMAFLPGGVMLSTGGPARGLRPPGRRWGYLRWRRWTRADRWPSRSGPRPSRPCRT